MVKSGSTCTLIGFFRANLAKSLTPADKVAEKRRVYLRGFMFLTISLISASKPNSNNLSA